MFRESKDKQMHMFDRLLTANEQTSKAVEKSRAKLVGDVIYPNVDENRFKPLYSDDHGSRPNIEIRRYVSALVLKRMYHMSDADFLEFLRCGALNFQYALHTTGEEKQPLSEVSLFRFIKEMESTINELEMKEDLAHRFLNEGFSGGEKKRNEIVQMKLLKPSLSMLDEIDSGLDVDAIRIVADALNRLREENGMSMIVVSHYERFLDLIKPEYTHVLVNGRIITSGGPELAERIDREGYDWIYREFNVQPAAEAETSAPRTTLGTCAVRETVKGSETK